MIKNDFKYDMENAFYNAKMTRQNVAERMGVTQGAVSQIPSRDIVNKKFVEAMEILGYDIELKYIDRNK